MRKWVPRVTKTAWLRPALIAAALYALMFILLSAVATPERYDIQTGHPAPVTIFATKDVEDTVTTQKLKDEAAAAVDFSYGSIDSTVVNQVITNFNGCYNALISLREEGLTDFDNISDQRLEEIAVKTGVTLTRSDVEAVCTAGSDTIEAVFNEARTLIRETLASTLPEGQEGTALSKVSRDLMAEGYDPNLVSATVAVTRATLRPNMLIDEETTELNRQRARDLIEPQMCIKGEAVVREGDIVTEAKYQILSNLGLIKDANFDLMLFLGIALIVLLVLAALGLYLYLYLPALLREPRKLLLLSLIILLVLCICVIARSLNTYLMPVALGLMLTATLLEPRLALFVNFMLGFVASLYASASTGVLSVATFSTMVMALVCGPFVVTVVTHHVQRTSMLLAGVVAGFSNFITTLAIGMINSASMSSVLINAAWASAGGILSAVICLGLQPLMEWLFNLVTNAKLLELSNPNQPLLHRLLLEAPGTYHHSIIVANLADAAANAIGANALLARVGAYYHDVGKLKRPMYFKENQIGDNPHDRTDPRVSTAILTAHTRDGAQMAQKEHLPCEIIDIIKSHHGDSPVLYFYDKAKKLYGDDVDISTFRYEGPRPAGREAAIVMLADIIEAATRSMPSHDPQKIEQLVRKLVRDKLTDGQLDRSQLTFRDLDTICNAFYTVLTGVFHERIEYPDVKLPPRIEPLPEAPEKDGDKES